jgi:hypothetical protein
VVDSLVEAARVPADMAGNLGCKSACGCRAGTGDLRALTTFQLALMPV